VAHSGPLFDIRDGGPVYATECRSHSHRETTESPIRLGTRKIAVDGKYGTDTKNAVNRIQRSAYGYLRTNGQYVALNPDGITGPQMWASCAGKRRAPVPRRRQGASSLSWSSMP